MIKDQCETCKKRNTDACQLSPLFDSTSCEHYVKRGIDLAKPGESRTVTPPPSTTLAESQHIQGPQSSSASASQQPAPGVITQDWLKQNTSIRGWLVFFLFACGLGGLISALYPVFTFDVNEYDGNFVLAWTDVLTGFMILGLAIYTIYSFRTRQTNAVFITKTYVVFVFCLNLLQLLIGEYETSGYMGSARQVGRGVIWGIVWFLYLCFSKQVKRVIPVDYRKRRKFDLWIIVSLIAVPLVFFIVGVSMTFASNQHKRDTLMAEVPLGPSEKTDGISIFKCPTGFSYTSQDVEPIPGNKIKVFNLESDYASITLCSDFDGDQSKKNFLDYWSNWKDEETIGHQEYIRVDENRDINGNPCWYRLACYDMDGVEVAWRFAMLFDGDNNAVTIISAYDPYPEFEDGPDAYFTEFLNDIRYR